MSNSTTQDPSGRGPIVSPAAAREAHRVSTSFDNDAKEAGLIHLGAQVIMGLGNQDTYYVARENNLNPTDPDAARAFAAAGAIRREATRQGIRYTEDDISTLASSAMTVAQSGGRQNGR